MIHKLLDSRPNRLLELTKDHNTSSYYPNSFYFSLCSFTVFMPHPSYGTFVKSGLCGGFNLSISKKKKTVHFCVFRSDVKNYSHPRC
mmetsp:Transcript_16400/g.18507  ORF Transcript_16400/g.18507 Transcript_16400/m.18507 type:complete len:87 (-) Transcript_16400:59-319(-)